MSFKDNVNTIDTPLYKRIRQNAVRFPTDQEILDQYKVYLVQKLKQAEYLNDLYKMNKNKNPELITIKNKLGKIKNAKLAQWCGKKEFRSLIFHFEKRNRENSLLRTILMSDYLNVFIQNNMSISLN